MASGDSSSSHPLNSRKDTQNQAQGTVALAYGGPDALTGPATGEPSSSRMASGVPLDLRDTRDEGSRQQVASASAATSSQSLQRCPGALDLTKGSGTSEQVAKNPPKRKLSKPFLKDWAAPEVGDALPMDVGNPQHGAAPTKKMALKRTRQYERLVRALQRLHITDAAERPGRVRSRKGALKMDLDGAEGTSGQGTGRQTTSEHGKESKRRSKGQKKKTKRASSADAVVARALKGKEAKKKPRGAGGKLPQSEGQQKPKTDPSKAGKKPRSGPSTCSGGGKSKRPRRTSSDPGSPSFVKLKSYVHLR